MINNPDEKYFKGIYEMVDQHCDPRVLEGIKKFGLPSFFEPPNDLLNETINFKEWRLCDNELAYV